MRPLLDRCLYFRYKLVANLISLTKDANRVTTAGGASAVPAGRGSSPLLSGGSDIMPAGTMTGVRGARCNWVRHRRHVRFVWCTYFRKPGPSCALGTMTPFGKSRGGTPEVVRAL